MTIVIVIISTATELYFLASLSWFSISIVYNMKAILMKMTIVIQHSYSHSCYCSNIDRIPLLFILLLSLLAVMSIYHYFSISMKPRAVFLINTGVRKLQIPGKPHGS